MEAGARLEAAAERGQGRRKDRADRATAEQVLDPRTRGLLLKLRFELDHYVNLRPSKLFAGAPGPLSDPGEIDFVVVRENTEDMYAGIAGWLKKNTADEVATQTAVYTRKGCERRFRALVGEMMAS